MFNVSEFFKIGLFDGLGSCLAVNVDSPCFSAWVAQLFSPIDALGAKFGTDVIFENAGSTKTGGAT